MKKKMTALNETQRRMVEGRLPVVHWAIRKHITTNETIYGFEYNDLFQEGCVWLCKAAVTFDATKKVKFETYAQTVVANGLRTYCRLMCKKQKYQRPTPETADEDAPFALEQIADDDLFEAMISEIDTLALLDALKAQYRGIVRLGIEAIEWKVKGLDGAEIAAMYGVKPTHVGAWIHRAAQRLRQNQMFLDAFPVENVPR
ncbi:MAG: sigma-70 family RNA polymerase sigma factor [Oscillospiraceae bacterium]|nr:sigma-70 family RNA polymerase sigma factor [Oscillospiraceae bacterium]